jgi:hypothetical protein
VETGLARMLSGAIPALNHEDTNAPRNHLMGESPTLGSILHVWLVIGSLDVIRPGSESVNCEVFDRSKLYYSISHSVHSWRLSLVGLETRSTLRPHNDRTISPQMNLGGWGDFRFSIFDF